MILYFFLFLFRSKKITIHATYNDSASCFLSFAQSIDGSIHISTERKIPQSTNDSATINHFKICKISNRDQNTQHDEQIIPVLSFVYSKAFHGTFNNSSTNKKTGHEARNHGSYSSDIFCSRSCGCNLFNN